MSYFETRSLSDHFEFETKSLALDTKRGYIPPMGGYQMSLIYGMKRGDYAILASESRITNSNMEILSDSKRKIIPFPEQNALIGYVGRYSFQAGDLEAIIADLDLDKENIVYRVWEKAVDLQKELFEHEFVNIHLIHAVSNQIQYHIFDLDSNFCIYKRMARDSIVHSGIYPVAPTVELCEMPNLEQDVNIIKTHMKNEIRYNTLRKASRGIGGPIQCYVLKNDGTILNFSD